MEGCMRGANARSTRSCMRMSAGSISSSGISASRFGVFFATLALSVYLFVIIPKGFFPQQDIGLLTGISEAAQETAPDQMMNTNCSSGNRAERSRG